MKAAALAASAPMTPGMSVLAFGVSGRPEVPLHQSPTSHFLEVSPGYFAALGIPVLQGREFANQDGIEDPRVLVINEALARREFPDQDPIGQRLSFGPGPDGEAQWREIVGVVGNVRQYRADEASVPMTYAVHTSSPQRGYSLIVRTDGDALALASVVRARLQAIDPTLPITRARTLDDVIGASLTQRKFNMTLLVVFASIALMLAIAGLYGAVAYAVAQRTQEMGIRVALGATAGEVLRLVLFDALKPGWGRAGAGHGSCVRARARARSAGLRHQHHRHAHVRDAAAAARPGCDARQLAPCAPRDARRPHDRAARGLSIIYPFLAGSTPSQGAPTGRSTSAERLMEVARAYTRGVS